MSEGCSSEVLQVFGLVLVTHVVLSYGGYTYAIGFGKKVNFLRVGREEAIKQQEEQQQKQKHIDACSKAIKDKGSVDQTIIQGLFIGFPRSGKSSLKERLIGKKLKKQGSTGAAEKVAHVEISMCQVSRGLHWKELDSPHSETVAVVGKISVHDTKAHTVSKTNPPTKSSDHDENVLPDEKPSFLASLLKMIFKQSSPSILKLKAEKSSLHEHPLEVVSSSLESINLDELESYLEDTWTLYMSDTGGQPEFQELIPVLVSGPALFFLVFRLDKSLHEKYLIEYLHPTTGESMIPFEASFTMEEMILQSLASIASTRVQTFLEDVTPKILFIGTHKDRVQSHEILELDKELQRIVKTTDACQEGMIVYASKSQMLHAVDNTSDDDADFQAVRATVEKIANYPAYRISTPFPWLMLGIILSRCENRVISYDECLQFGRECEINSRAELNHALWFLHYRLGIIRHFQTVPALQHVIIKEPQYIFDKVTELIVDTFIFEKANIHGNALEEFRKQGIFPKSIFEKISTGYDILSSSQFIALLEHLHIVAPIHEDDEVTKYFLPCALTHADLPPDTDESTMVPPLLLMFNSGYCPRGMFGSLMVRLIKRNKEDSEFTWKLEQDKIYRNQVQMSVGPYDSFRFRQLSKSIRIDLVFSSSKRRGLALGRVCCDVRQCLENSIRTVTKTLNYSHKATHSLAFAGPEHHPATINIVDGVPHNMECTLTGTRYDLPDGYQFWFDKAQTIPITGIHDEAVVRPGVAASLPSPLDTPLTYQNVTTSLRSLVNWHDFGVQLGIEKSKLDMIRLDFDKWGCSRQKDELIAEWLRSDTNASWSKLCTALDKINEKTLAEEIRRLISQRV